MSSIAYFPSDFNQNNFIDILFNLSYYDIYHCLFVCKDWSSRITLPLFSSQEDSSETLIRKNIHHDNKENQQEQVTPHQGKELLWKHIYRNLLYEKALQLASHTIDDYIRQYIEHYYDAKEIYQSYYHDFFDENTLQSSSSISSMKLASSSTPGAVASDRTSNWRSKVEQIAKLLSDLPMDQEQMKEEGPNQDQLFNIVQYKPHRWERLTRRCGHSAHIVTLPLDDSNIDIVNKTAKKEEFLVLLSGATTGYLLLNTAEVISLTKNEVTINSYFSLVRSDSESDRTAPGWFHSHFVLDNKIYLFGSGDGINHNNDIYCLQLINRNQVESVRIIPHFENPSDQPPRDIMFGTFVLDPIESIKENIRFRKAIFFGGRNKVTDHMGQTTQYLYFNDVFVLNIISNGELLPSMQWKKQNTNGDGPCPRCCHSTILIGRNMYVFGGWSHEQYALKGKEATTYEDEAVFNDLYILNIDSFHWTKIITYGIPPCPRCQSNVMPLPDIPLQIGESLFRPDFQNQNFVDAKYLAVLGGSAFDSDFDNDLCNICLLDLETNCWIPLNREYFPLRGGCLAQEGIIFYTDRQLLNSVTVCIIGAKVIEFHKYGDSNLHISSKKPKLAQLPKLAEFANTVVM